MVRGIDARARIMIVPPGAAHGRAFFDDGEGNTRTLQIDRRAQSRNPGADDDNLEPLRNRQSLLLQLLGKKLGLDDRVVFGRYFLRHRAAQHLAAQFRRRLGNRGRTPRAREMRYGSSSQRSSPVNCTSIINRVGMFAIATASAKRCSWVWTCAPF